jgi:hypothetical protein
MSLPYRPLFRYGENLSLALELPVTPWVRHTTVVGGDIEADSGARAAYVVRRDELLTFTLRFYEEEWPFVQFLIDYGQSGQLLVWYPDRDDLSVQFTCYLESPSIDGSYQPTPDGEYPRAFLLEITLARGTWPLPPWNTDDVVVPDVPEGWIIHFFTINDVFTVFAGFGYAEILIVGGGASGGSVDGTGVGAGGGGAGGIVHKPLEAIGPGAYNVYVASGASSNHADHMIGIGAVQGNDGGESSFGPYAAQGGGGGGAVVPTYPMRQGRDGASGGGGASSDGDFIVPPSNNWEGGHAVHGSQGNDGGPGTQAHDTVGGGGGGAGSAGSLGSGGQGALYSTASPVGTPTMYSIGGRANMGLAASASGYGGGGGGGHAPFADGAAGNGGLVVVKYRMETGIVATGGIRVEYPDP